MITLFSLDRSWRHRRQEAHLLSSSSFEIMGNVLLGLRIRNWRERQVSETTAVYEYQVSHEPMIELSPLEL